MTPLTFSHCRSTSHSGLLSIQRCSSIQPKWGLFPFFDHKCIKSLSCDWLTGDSVVLLSSFVWFSEALNVQSPPCGHVCSYYSVRKGDVWQSGLSLLARTFWFSSPSRPLTDSSSLWQERGKPRTICEWTIRKTASAHSPRSSPELLIKWALYSGSNGGFGQIVVA